MNAHDLDFSMSRSGKNEPCREKTCLRGFLPGSTQIGLTATEDSKRLVILDLESSSKNKDAD